MGFQTDTKPLKDGLIIFRRTDVKHHMWYCRMAIPKDRRQGANRYKTVCLKTTDEAAAMRAAFSQEMELHFKVKHEMPVFSRTFAQVAQEYSDKEKGRSEVGQITHHRWRVQESHIKKQLNRFLGKHQITLIGQDRWQEYPVWRQRNGEGRSGGKVSDGTIRSEMATLKSIMAYAASKQYIRESQVFKGKLPVSKARREEFTPQEYRSLHTFARGWISKGRREMDVWYRTVAYNFILIMTNTGMRPAEAKNLRWKDVSIQADKHNRSFVRVAVRGKDKYRNLVASSNVATYFERIKEISKAVEPKDFVFTTDKGKPAKTLYHSLIERLLLESKLTHSSSGSRRSTYCFRHTYATFRLSEGVDSFYLAKQMGTSVKMIEDHYGHVNPVKNAERVLQGLPGWEPIEEVSGEKDDSLNADADGKKRKPKKKK